MVLGARCTFLSRPMNPSRCESRGRVPRGSRRLFGGALCLAGFLLACASAVEERARLRLPAPAPEEATPPDTVEADEPAAPGTAPPPAVGALEERWDGVLAASLPAGAVIGVVLPVSGSPSNRIYAQEFLAGARLAAELARELGADVELAVEDNRGTASGSIQGTVNVISRGAKAILGPLSSDNVRVAADAAPDNVPLFSPTARVLPGGRRGLFSLAAGDPAAGRSLARLLVDRGHRDAVIVHSAGPAETLEARVFEDAFTGWGGIVGDRIPYVAGTTTFDEPLMRAQALSPQVLVVFAPVPDLELLAPQIEFFGLKDDGMQIAGTSAWSTDAVLGDVAARHTDGVLAISTRPAGSSRAVPGDFIEEYETRFQRSLVSEVPAVGFDLLRMALGALAGQGAGESGDLQGALERLGRFRGLTGTYQFQDGLLTREYYPVVIYGGALHPSGFRPPEPDTIAPDTGAVTIRRN